MELVLLKIKNGPLWGTGPRRSGDRLAAVLAHYGHRSCFVGRATLMRRHMAPDSSAITAEADDEVVCSSPLSCDTLLPGWRAAAAACLHHLHQIALGAGFCLLVCPFWG
jgi:hypothetical protein